MTSITALKNTRKLTALERHFKRLPMMAKGGGDCLQLLTGQITSPWPFSYEQNKISPITVQKGGM